MWNAISYVTTGLALTAFIWAIFLSMWLGGLRTERDKVRSAAPKDRIEALKIAAEYIGVDLKDIPEGDRTRIVLQQMQHKSSIQKFKISAALIIGVLGLLLAGYVIANQGRGTPDEAVRSSKPVFKPEVEAKAAEAATEKSVLVPPSLEEKQSTKDSAIWAQAQGGLNKPVASSDTSLKEPVDGVEIVGPARSPSGERLIRLPSKSDTHAPNGTFSGDDMTEMKVSGQAAQWGWVYLGDFKNGGWATKLTKESLPSPDDLVGEIYESDDQPFLRDDPPTMAQKSGKCVVTNPEPRAYRIFDGQKFKVVRVEVGEPPCDNAVWALIGTPVP